MNLSASKPTTTRVTVPVGTDLTCLLESLVRGGATAHGTAAGLFYKEFQAATDIDSKRLFAAEIFCRLMQSVEDVGALALFALAGAHDDISTYFTVQNREIMRFYGSCQPALPDADIDRIYGLPTVEELLKSGQLAASHKESCVSVFEQFRSLAREQFRQRGSLYCRYDEERTKWVHSDLLQMHLKAKHGMRVFLPSPARASAMDIPETHLAILIGLRDPKDPENRDIEIGSFPLDNVALMVQQVLSTCSHLKELAEVRLGVKSDPLYVFKAMRERASDQGTVSGIEKPGRNEPCFCGSDKKFKKCHGQ